MLPMIRVRVPAGRDGRVPYTDAEGAAHSTRRYAGRGPAPEFAPLPEGQLVPASADVLRAIASGDLEEAPEPTPTPAPGAQE